MPATELSSGRFRKRRYAKNRCPGEFLEEVLDGTCFRQSQSSGGFLSPAAVPRRSCGGRIIDDFRKGSANTPPIWGLNRSDKAAQAVLYQKGPLLLHQLESSMGKESFRRFLATLVQRKVSTTDQLLTTLEELTSKEVRTSFEQGLKE